MAKETIVVGLTGKIDSTVAAYLLKKQGYRVIGICLQLFAQSEDKEYYGHCQSQELDEVKRVADALEIPFYAVNATQQYQEKVISKIVNSGLSDYVYNPCVSCTNLKIRILLDKAEKLGATKVATGHYAKLIKNHQTGKTQLMRSNNMDNDQSFLLANLDNELLSKLVLPLSDIRLEEVERISETLGFNFLEKKFDSKKKCFYSKSGVSKLIEEHSPESMRSKGEVLTYKDENLVNDHAGIHKFFIGDGSSLRKTANADKDLVVVAKQPSNGKVFIFHEGKMKVTHLVIEEFKSLGDDDVSKPIKCVVRFHQNSSFYSCLLLPRNNGKAFVILDKEIHKILPSGSSLVFYDHEGKSAKALYTGILSMAGHFDRTDFLVLPRRNKSYENEGLTAIEMAKLTDLKF